MSTSASSSECVKRQLRSSATPRVHKNVTCAQTGSRIHAQLSSSQVIVHTPHPQPQRRGRHPSNAVGHRSLATDALSACWGKKETRHHCELEEREAEEADGWILGAGVVWTACGSG